MLSGVLRSDRAIAVNIEIMRAFVEVRRVAGSFRELHERPVPQGVDVGGAGDGERHGGVDRREQQLGAQVVAAAGAASVPRSSRTAADRRLTSGSLTRERSRH